MAPESKIVPTTSGASTTGVTSTNVVPLPHRPEPTTPSEKAVSFVKRHPVLTVAGGLAIGVAVSALIPRSFSRRLAKRALRYAEAGAATALAFGHDAIDKAEDGGVIARKKAQLLAGRAERFGERAAARAEKLGERAYARAEKLSSRAAARAEKLSDRAAARAERLGIAALGTANVLGHAAAERAEFLGHAAAVRAESLGESASDRFSQLGDKALAQSSRLFGVPKVSKGIGARVLDKAHGVGARLR